MSQARLNEWNCFFANNPIRLYFDCDFRNQEIKKYYDLLCFDFEGIFLNDPSEKPELRDSIFRKYQNDGSNGLKWIIFADFMLEELFSCAERLNLSASDELEVLMTIRQLARRWELFASPRNAGKFRMEYAVLDEKILKYRMEISFANNRFGEDFEQDFWFYDILMDDYIDKILAGESGFERSKLLSKLGVFAKIGRRANLFSHNENFISIPNRTLARLVVETRNNNKIKSSLVQK